jgi:hypothetical protein
MSRKINDEVVFTGEKNCWPFAWGSHRINSTGYDCRWFPDCAHLEGHHAPTKEYYYNTKSGRKMTLGSEICE